LNFLILRFSFTYIDKLFVISYDFTNNMTADNITRDLGDVEGLEVKTLEREHRILIASLVGLQNRLGIPFGRAVMIEDVSATPQREPAAFIVPCDDNPGQLGYLALTVNEPYGLKVERYRIPPAQFRSLYGPGLEPLVVSRDKIGSGSGEEIIEAAMKPETALVGAVREGALTKYTRDAMVIARKALIIGSQETHARIDPLRAPLRQLIADFTQPQGLLGDVRRIRRTRTAR
jgi:hypothetical protein